MANSNHREDLSNTLISKARVIWWQHVFVFNGFSYELCEAKRRYSTNFQKNYNFFLA
jgi:hypothetical protein